MVGKEKALGASPSGARRLPGEGKRGDGLPPRRIAWPSSTTERLRKALSVRLPGRVTRRRAPLLTGGDASLFGYRVISPGRTTLASRLRGEHRFGCQIESPGRQTTQKDDIDSVTGLVAAPDCPVVKPAATVRTRGIGLITRSNHPAVKLSLVDGAPW